MLSVFTKLVFRKLTSFDDIHTSTDYGNVGSYYIMDDFNILFDFYTPHISSRGCCDVAASDALQSEKHVKNTKLHCGENRSA